VITKMRSIQMLAIAVLCAATWGLTASPAAGCVDCTQQQWCECYCSAPGQCQAQMPPPDPGNCWLGEPIGCENGTCEGGPSGCYQVEEEFCEGEMCPGGCD